MNASNTVTAEYSFDAWGRRRDKDDWSYTLNSEPDLTADRGFTGHEHLSYFNIVNMNGRLYDPLVARFLSPDENVQIADYTQNFNRYSYCLNNPLIYTDSDGEWIHIAVGAVIGGVINLATNWKNIDSFGEGLAAFGAGAAQGALTAAFGPIGAMAGGALTGATNGIIAQTGNGIGLGDVNWGQVGLGAGVGGVAGIAGYGAGQWASSNLGGVVINGFNISANSALGGTITGAIGGAVGGYAGGFTGGLLMTGDLSAAHQAGIGGLWMGAGIGAGTGAVGGYISAQKAGLNPWTGRPNNSITIGEGMSTNPEKGWMGVDKISEDLGSGKFEPKNLPKESWYTDGALMKENAAWIEMQMQQKVVIYDRGPVGNNSQYYNMEVGRTMDYNNVYKVKAIYNKTQTIRVLIIKK